MVSNDPQDSKADDGDSKIDYQKSDSRNTSVNQTLSLTSFLFGNIDITGQLEGDVFDPEVKRHLASLSRLGLGSLLRQVTDDGDEEDDEEEDDNTEEESVEKNPSAVDYSDILEAVEDETFPDTTENDSSIDMHSKRSIPSKSDSELMPAPPPPPPSSTSDVSLNGTHDSKKHLTPLAAMLPLKYINTDIREIFPNFRHGSVLRFSKLFGPGKPSHLPKIWKHVRKKKKKKMDDTETSKNDTASDTPFSESYDPSLFNFSKIHSCGFDLMFGPQPLENECVEDDELSLSRISDPKTRNSSQDDFEKTGTDSKKLKEAAWRYGPAQLWYDMLDIQPMGEDFDYGFKVKPKAYDDVKEGVLHYHKKYNTSNVEMEDIDEEEFPDEAFHMVTQYNWEDDIIWNGDDPKHKNNQKRKNMAAGWVPSSYSRTANAFSQPSKPTSPFPVNKNAKGKSQILYNNDGDDTWYSIFPVENEELVYERWEDDIIWDPENMDNIPEPKMLTLDPNDENIILGIPEDIDPASLSQGETPVKVKIPHPHVKKSKILLGKAGVITTIEEESPPPPPKSPDKDPFNLSNDEFYQAKSTEQAIKRTMGGGMLQHSTPVVELQVPVVATFMGEKKLRMLHRPPLKHFSHGPLSIQDPHPVHSLLKEIKKKAKQRELERLTSGGGDVFFMRTLEDLTGKDGDLIMVEYCEEFPPILSQVGMCTRIKNYYKRKLGNDKGPPEYRFGEASYIHTSPFLGSMHPGQSIQTLENNMYRSPLFEHKMPTTDFLIIRTRNGYSVREIDTLFCSGQQCALYEVPGPNSKRANNFIRDFLQVFIYRLFWKSEDAPRRIKMDAIKRAFPAHSESSIRKRLKPCAEFRRTGADSNWWVIRDDFRLPTEDEIRAMISPEQCAGYFSMLSAEQRLKDAGYGDKFLSSIEEDNDDDTQKLDDEIKVAPWHTTRAYCQAVDRKCLLQLTGAADPTGCGEGFSYIRIPNKPTLNKEEQEQQPKRIVTGTDADLRKLSLNDAKNLLRNYGVPEEEIKKLSRWEVIDVVRTLSTEKAKAGEEGMNKFSRGNRFSIAEHQERYKEECQRIFDLQNRVLASDEVLSTDEGSSEEEDNDSDMEEKGKYIENLLANKKTSTQLTLEKEEEERKALQKILLEEDDKEEEKKKEKKEDEDALQYGYGTSGRLLKITRTFRNVDGKKYTRVETVRKTSVIDFYVKIRTTKDDKFIYDFAGQYDDAKKEEIKRERRRLQEQLRRIKRNQERIQKGIVTPPKVKKPKLKPDLKLKCGACGQVGHMRTNKACPLYTSNYGLHPSQPVSVPLTETQDEESSAGPIEESDELVNVDGTKIKLSSKVVKQAETLKRKSLLLKVPKDQIKGNKKKRAGNAVHCDYLKKKTKSINRIRIDPAVTLATIFEEILNEMREMDNVQPFLFPVNSKQVPDYYNVIQHPMDLASMRDNLRQKKYQSREEFLCDVSQILENSKLYNGVNSTLTMTALKMFELCIDRFAEKEETLMRLEKAINPLLDDDDQVAFDYILDNIVNTKLFSMQESRPFMKPVNKKNVKDYYEIIEQPMDLQTIAKKVKNHKYHSRAEFMYDIELLYTNSNCYNGPDSPFTHKAKILIDFCRNSLAEYETHLEDLEKKISLAKERAMEQAETDSFVMSLHDEEQYQESSRMNSSHETGDNFYDDNNQLNVDGEEETDVKPNIEELNKRIFEERKLEAEDDEMVPEKRFKSEAQSNVLKEDLDCSDDEDEQIRKNALMESQNKDQYLFLPISSTEDNEPYQGLSTDKIQMDAQNNVDINLLPPNDDSLASQSEPELNSILQEKVSTINNDLAISDSDDEKAADDNDESRLWF